MNHRRRAAPPQRLLIWALLFSAAPLAAQSAARRRIEPNDFYRLRNVADPQLSPDGNWVAYSVKTADSASDKNRSNLYMTSWDGSQTVQLTHGKESQSSPRWSPDGRYLAFLSGRGDTNGDQVWLLDRRGGEAEKITTLRYGVDEIAWSPDSRRIALLASIEFDSAKRADSSDKPKPIVINRYLYKQDVEGYLTTSRDRLILLDVASRKLDTLDTGPGDVASPRWSPDSRQIAFVHMPVIEPGVGDASDLEVVASEGHAAPRRLTGASVTVSGTVSWSPDGTVIAFLHGQEPKWSAYQLPELAIVRADGWSPPSVISHATDRAFNSPTFSADGHSVLAIEVDDRAQYLARVTIATGSVQRLDHERHAVEAYSAGQPAGARIATLVSSSDRPSEVYAFDNGVSRQLSHQNDSLVGVLALGAAEDLTSRSKDGTEVHSVLLRPPGSAAGTRLPTLFLIHGGPNSQSDYSFNATRQMLAARGYAVISPNYRGSLGRGQAYQRAIFADWGHLEIVDILGAVDEAVRAGIADSNHLGIGGWSYGGISTDYAIASTNRFKAAVSGAGSALQLTMYGTDEYITQYELELGPPWKNPDRWINLSYPFFHADRIRTPTLFLGGEADFNVPVIGGQQMYQALRELGVPTGLVIYPAQFHGITRPSFVVDVANRYINWFDRYLDPAGDLERRGGGN